MEEIPLSNSSESFEHIEGFTDDSDSEMNRLRGSSSDFVEVSYEDLKPKPPLKSVLNSADLNIADFNTVAEALAEEDEMLSKKSTFNCKEEVVNESFSPSPINENCVKPTIVPVAIDNKSKSTSIVNGDIFNVKIKKETEKLISSLLVDNLSSKQLPPLKPRENSLEPKIIELKMKPIKHETMQIVKSEVKLEGLTSNLPKKRKTKYELLQEKKQKRLIKNRASAKLHRQKLKNKHQKIENELLMLKKLNKSLQISMNNLLDENCRLKDKISYKDQEIERLLSENSILRDNSGENQLSKDLEDLPKLLDEENPFFQSTDTDIIDADNSSILSWFIGSSGSISGSSVASSTDQSSGKRKKRKLRNAARRANRIISENAKTITKGKAKSTLTLFAFSFFLSILNIFLYKRSTEHVISLPVSSAENYISMPMNISQIRARNISQAADIKFFGDPKLEQLELTLEPIEVDFLPAPPPKLPPISPTSMNSMFVPITTGRMMDFAKEMKLQLVIENESQPSNKELVSTVGNVDDMFFKRELWQEFTKLNNIVRSRPTYFEGSTVKYLDTKSQAVVLYNDNPETKQLMLLDAISVAFQTYLSFLKGDHSQKWENFYQPNYPAASEFSKENYILCPTAYGALSHFVADSASFNNKFTAQKDDIVAKPRLRNKRKMLVHDKDYGKLNSTINSDKSDHPLLTIVVPSHKVTDDDKDHGSLLELSCRIEQIQEIIVG